MDVAVCRYTHTRRNPTASAARVDLALAVPGPRGGDENSSLPDPLVVGTEAKNVIAPISERARRRRRRAKSTNHLVEIDSLQEVSLI